MSFFNENNYVHYQYNYEYFTICLSNAGNDKNHLVKINGNNNFKALIFFQRDEC